MIQAWRSVVLQRVCDFLGAEYIRSDIDLALQSEALKEQFNKWVFHVLSDERAGRRFENVHFYSTLAHPELSCRLKGARDILELQYVNKVLQMKCLEVLKLKQINAYELVCASQPVQIPAISLNFGSILRKTRFKLEKQTVCALSYEEQRECIRKLRFLEDSFRQLLFLKRMRLLKWRALKGRKEAVQKRMYNGEVFSWEECVDWWGYYYEISALYEWFIQLEKVS